MSFDYNRIAFALQERPRHKPLKWWRNESLVCQMLGLQSKIQLDEFVLRCSKGYTGTRSDRVYNAVPFNTAIDLRVSNNILGLRYDDFGRKGVSESRHYAFDYANATAVSFKAQQEIIQWVQGTHPELENWPDMKQR